MYPKLIKAGLFIALIISSLLAITSLVALISIVISVVTWHLSTLQLHLVLMATIGFIPVFIGFCILLEKRKTYKVLPALSIVSVVLCLLEKVISMRNFHINSNEPVFSILMNIIFDPVNIWMLISIYYFIVLIVYKKEFAKK